MLELMKKALLFLIGPPNNVLYAAATFFMVNGVLDFFRKHDPPKTKAAILRGNLEKLLAYTAFLIIANRIDAMAIGHLFGWEGSTQLLVCIFLFAREVRLILDYIQGRGIQIPFILDTRLTQMEKGELQSMQQGDEIMQRLASLQEKMAYLQSLVENQKRGEKS